MTSSSLERIGTLIQPRIAVVVGLCVWCVTVSAIAQQAGVGVSAEVGIADQLTIEQLQAKIKELEGQGVGDKDTDVAKALELYNLALTRVQATEAHKSSAQAYKRSIETAPKEAQRLRKELAAQEAKGQVAIKAAATPGEVEQQLAKELAELTTAKNRLAELESQVQAQQDRPAQAQREVATAKQKLDEVEQRLKPVVVDDKQVVVRAAQRVADQAWKQALLAEIHMLEQEHVSRAVRRAFSIVQRDVASRRVSHAEVRVKDLQEALADRRRADAARTSQEAELARLEAIGKHSVIQNLAEQNAELGRELNRVVKQMEDVAGSQVSAQDQARRIEQEFQNAKQKLEIAGYSGVIGRVLRDEQKELPNVRRYRASVAQRKERLAEVGLRQLRHDEELSGLEDLSAATAHVMAGQVDGRLAQRQRDEIESRVRKLLGDKKDLLTKLESAYRRYLRELIGLDYAERRLVESAGRYASFLDQRLMWIPSAGPIKIEAVGQVRQGVSWFVDVDAWREVWQEVSDWSRPGVETAVVSVVLLGVAGLVSMLSRLRVRLGKVGDRVGTVYADSFWLTVQGLAITILLALPWASLVWLMAWLVLWPGSTSAFAWSVGWALVWSGVLLFVLQSVRVLCRPGGVAQEHFRWPTETLGRIRRDVLWLGSIEWVAMFVGVVAEQFDEDLYRNGLGRVLYIVGMVAMSVFLHRALGGGAGVLGQSSHRGNRNEGWWGIRYVCYPLAVLVPLALSMLAAVGYYYTALQLNHRLAWTLGLAAVVVVLYSLAIRWLVVANVKLAVARTLESREATTAGGQKAGTRDPKDKRALPEYDLATISGQSWHLLRLGLWLVGAVGLWAIWSDLIPALGLFSYEVWGVSVSNALAGVLAGVVTWVAGRNVPGLLEMALLRRLPIDAGSRYAVTTISRYTITAVGVVAVCQVVGVDWSKVQWLIAALGVGLGFGLQEVVANFVSGLIILFERPFRVGDTVTVGDVNGMVSRIRIRATTVTDWDRKELIVPNKAFITDRLINWTLSDKVIRVVVPVGIAYGSDTQKAHRVLLEVAQANKSVLKDPLPTVLFRGFGDSTLDFELRAFVEQTRPQGWLAVSSELHMAIDQAFRENSIEIAFPQRDLHVKSLEPRVLVSRQENTLTVRSE